MSGSPASFREFIQSCDELGEVKRISGANWDLEIGTIDELIQERRGPMPLFDSIKGGDFPPSYTVATSPYLTTRRTAIALGMPPDISKFEMVRKLKDKIGPQRGISSTVEVHESPIYENVQNGDEVNLFSFPVPKWHELDGGRYIGTGCVVITKDLNEGWVNLGPYRLQLHEKNLTGIMSQPSHHGRVMMQKYWKTGKSCPVAVAIGVEPAVFIASAHNLPWGQSEYDLAASLADRQIKVIRGRLTNLPIPASSEIVFEGEIPPPEVETHTEGPFGEYTGYYAGGRTPEPVIRVKALYFQNNPVMHGDPPLKPPIGGHFGAQICNNPSVWKRIENSGLPGIKGVFLHDEGSGAQFCVVSIEQKYNGHSTQVGLVAAGCVSDFGNFIVIVDDDVDPANLQDVIWAMSTRCNPEKAIKIVSRTPSHLLDPRVDPALKMTASGGGMTASRVIIDACRPFEFMKSFPQVNVASQELRKTIKEKWSWLLTEPAAVKASIITSKEKPEGKQVLATA